MLYYHGTSNDSADAIVRTQIMNPSRGDSEWLGDGCYFYDEPVYAFRWILIKYTENFRNEFTNNYDGIFNEYAIVSAKIEILPDRLFSLENIHHRMIFISTKNALIERGATSDEYKARIEKQGIVDGVVFNYLFQHAGYQYMFDAIKAVFPICYIFDDSRMEYLPEPQICVVNPNIIKDFEKYSGDTVPEEYKQFIVEYVKLKYSLREKRSKKGYKNKRARIKYT